MNITGFMMSLVIVQGRYCAFCMKTNTYLMYEINFLQHNFSMQNVKSRIHYRILIDNGNCIFKCTWIE